MPADREHRVPRLRLEQLLYVAIVGGTLLLRAVDVDNRPFHHDESIHAYTAWKVLQHGVSDYEYDPVYHGPVLYYLGALVQAVSGSSDASARWPAVLCGVGLVALAWPLRPLVGRRAALAFALLAAVSPTLGYYGRSLRHDVPMAFFTLAAVVACAHYLRTGRRGLAYGAGILAGLAIATKEDAYLLAVVLVAALTVTPVLAREEPGLRGAWRRAVGLARAAPPLLPLATGTLLAGVVFLVLYTSLLTRPDHWDAAIRAVRYWWQQHQVRRIAGPWWYYVPFLAAYEPLILIGAVLAVVGFCVRGGASPFAAFAGGWAVFACIAYSWAQEKVPWLLVPMLVPLALVAAHHVARLGRVGLACSIPVGVFTLWSLVASNYLYGALRPGEPADGYRLEPLAYVQTTYDVTDVVARIDAVGRRLGRSDVPLVVSGQAVWPLSWYLRDRSVTWNVIPPETEAPVIVVDVVDADAVARQLGPTWHRERFAVRGWWMVDWADATPARVARFLLWRQPWGRPGTTDAVLFTSDAPPSRVTLRVPAPALGYPIPATVVTPSRMLADGGTLAEPRAVAVAGDGSLIVADTKHHRVVRLDPSDGAVRGVWGGPEPGDAVGRFREPNGVAVGPDGDVWVADTWNHRVQRFGADGTWRSDLRPADRLWGPRAVAIAPDGTVFVADTGNKRIVRFDATGRELAAFGGEGGDPGKLVEPVGLAIDPATGLLWVADTGNRRIQAFDLEGRYRRAWRVPGWEQFYSEPSLAWDGGVLWATDAYNGRLNGFDAEGRLRWSLGVGGMPRGVAVRGDDLVVVDSLTGRVVVYPRPAR